MMMKNVSVRVSAGKAKGKTASSSVQGDPVWNELLFVHVPRKAAELKVELYAKGEIVAEASLGQARDIPEDTGALPLLQLPDNRKDATSLLPHPRSRPHGRLVVDSWYPLHRVSRKDAAPGAPCGDIHVRLYHSVTTEKGRDFGHATDDQSDLVLHYNDFLKTHMFKDVRAGSLLVSP